MAISAFFRQATTSVQQTSAERTNKTRETVKGEVSSFVAGSLKFFLPQWQKVTSDQFILTCVTGYEIEFDEHMPINYCKSKTIYTPLSKTEEKLLEVELNKLLGKQVLEETSHIEGEFISPVFLRPKPNGSFRMILNLKDLNQSVKYYHFKMDSLQAALRLSSVARGGAGGQSAPLKNSRGKIGKKREKKEERRRK